MSGLTGAVAQLSVISYKRVVLGVCAAGLRDVAVANMKRVSQSCYAN